jgi:hypothetical protein
MSEILCRGRKMLYTESTEGTEQELTSEPLRE